jgi:hypothetical protein
MPEKVNGMHGEGRLPGGVARDAEAQVRELAGHRCIRCLHPYRKGDGEWSRCDDDCATEDPWLWTPTD